MIKISIRDNLTKLAFVNTKNVVTTFGYINREFFNNELIVPTLRAVNKKVKNSYASFIYDSIAGGQPSIYIYNADFPDERDSFDWIQDLIHEMCHYWMWTKYIKPVLGNKAKVAKVNPIVQSHNEEFEAKCDECLDKILPPSRKETPEETKERNEQHYKK